MPWSQCRATCGHLNKGQRKRQRICYADREVFQRKCPLGENCTSFDDCSNQQIECDVSAEEYKYKCEKSTICFIHIISY